MKMAARIICALYAVSCAVISLGTATVLYENSSAAMNLSQVTFPLSPTTPVPQKLVILSGKSYAVDFHQNLMYGTLKTQELPLADRINYRQFLVGIMAQPFYNGSKQFMPLPKESNPTSLAVDVVTGVIYMADGATNTIDVINFEQKGEATILWKNVKNPSNLILDSNNRKIFWLNKGETTTVEVANLDGSGHKTFITPIINSPLAIALDQTGNRLYWVGDKRIESIGVDGTGKLHHSDNSLTDVNSLAVDTENFYLTTTHNSSVYRISKNSVSTASYELIENNEVTPNTVSIHQNSSNGPLSVNPCLNTSCTHICLRVGERETKCVCPFGYAIQPDQKCQKGEYKDTLYVADIERRRIFLVDLENGAVKPLENTGMTNAYSLTGNPHTGKLYWADPSVNLYSCNVSKDCSDIASPLQFEFKGVHALAMNNKDQLIYMSLIPNTLSNSKIAVVPADGERSYRILIDDDSKPASLAYDPKSSCLFWTDPIAEKIYRHNMSKNVEETLVEVVTGGYENLHTVQVDDPNLFWSHKDGIDMCGINGKIVSTFLSYPDSRIQSFALTEDKVYYTLENGSNIYWANRNDTSQTGFMGPAMFGNITSVYFSSPVLSVHPPMQPGVPLVKIVAPVVSAGVVLMAVAATGYILYRKRQKAMMIEMQMKRASMYERQFSGPYDNLYERMMDDYPGYGIGHIRASRIQRQQTYVAPVPLPPRPNTSPPVFTTDQAMSEAQDIQNLPRHTISLPNKNKIGAKAHDDPQRAATVSGATPGENHNEINSDNGSTYLTLLPVPVGPVSASDVRASDIRASAVIA